LPKGFNNTFKNCPLRFKQRYLTLEYLVGKADREAIRREQRGWSNLSLAFAMRGMEDESTPTYTTSDLKVAFS